MNVRVQNARGRFIREYKKVNHVDLGGLLLDLRRKFNWDDFILRYDYGANTTDRDLLITVYDGYVE